MTSKRFISSSSVLVAAALILVAGILFFSSRMPKGSESNPGARADQMVSDGEQALAASQDAQRLMNQDARNPMPNDPAVVAAYRAADAASDASAANNKPSDESGKVEIK